jgi:hypothetical protein
MACVGRAVTGILGLCAGREAREQFVIILEPHYCAPLAQLDRASGYEPEGREFESLRARHKFNNLGHSRLSALCYCPLSVRLGSIDACGALRHGSQFLTLQSCLLLAVRLSRPQSTTQQSGESDAEQIANVAQARSSLTQSASSLREVSRTYLSLGPFSDNRVFWSLSRVPSRQRSAFRLSVEAERIAGGTWW